MVVGLVLLASAALLGMWSPAVPLTGGLAWGVGLGVLYIGWPTLVEGWIDSAYSTAAGHARPAGQHAERRHLARARRPADGGRDRHRRGPPPGPPVRRAHGRWPPRRGSRPRRPKRLGAAPPTPRRRRWPTAPGLSAEGATSGRKSPSSPRRVYDPITWGLPGPRTDGTVDAASGDVVTDPTHQPTLDNLLSEDRTFPPGAEFAAQANAHPEMYAWAQSDRLAFWAEQARSLLDWDTPFTEVLDWSRAPVARWFADGRLNACANAVDRHVAAGRGDRVALLFEGEPGDTRTLTYAELQREVSQAANALTRAGRDHGRPGRDLPADDPRGGHLDARLRADRRRALRRVRRVLRRGAALPDRRRPGLPGDHRRRRLPARQGQCAQAGRRRGARRGQDALGPIDATASTVRHVLVVRRTGQDVDWTEGRDVWWHDALDGRVRPAHPGGRRRRAPAVHPLHLGHHREAEGHLPHHRRLPDPGGLHAPERLRPQARDRRLLVHRRHRLDHRAQLRRLRPAGQRRHPGDLRGHPGHPAPGSLVGDRPEVRRDHPVHRADRDPDLHEVGRGHPGAVRPVLACACSARWASRSTPRPGCGTAG